MTLVVMASAKGSPGVTTLAAALAATWPVGRDLLVAEVDPAGGDLASRLDLPGSPGLVTLAAAARRELTGAVLDEHLQDLPGRGGIRLLAGPVSADQAAAALQTLGGRLAGVLASRPEDVLVDCGRLDGRTRVLDHATAAGALVVVVRPTVAAVHHLATRLESLAPPLPVGVVVVGDRPYSAPEVAAAVGATLVAEVPVDARAAAALAGEGPAGRALERSPLVRAARQLAGRLASASVPSAVGAAV